MVEQILYSLNVVIVKVSLSLHFLQQLLFKFSAYTLHICIKLTTCFYMFKCKFIIINAHLNPIHHTLSLCSLHFYQNTNKRIKGVLFSREYYNSSLKMDPKVYSDYYLHQAKTGITTFRVERGKTTFWKSVPVGFDSLKEDKLTEGYVINGFEADDEVGSNNSDSERSEMSFEEASSDEDIESADEDIESADECADESETSNTSSNDNEHLSDEEPQRQLGNERSITMRSASRRPGVSKVADTLRKHLLVLEFIFSIKNQTDREQTLLIALKNHEIKKTIKEIVENYLEQTYEITDPDTRNQLRKHKEAMIKIHQRRSVKETLMQDGYGFLPILIPIVTALLDVINS